MRSYFLGVDGGGSKTLAVVLDDKGLEVGRGVGGPSNYHLVGADSLRRTLSDTIGAALMQAGIGHHQVSAAVWALAGAGRPIEARYFEKLKAELMPGVRGQVVTDAVGALVGGTGSRFGIALIAGTGMMAYGENAAGETARAGGWGHIIDEGSGYGLARGAFQALFTASDGIDLATNLLQKLLERLDIAGIDDLVHWIYAPERKVSEIAELAPLVLSAAENGDLMATEVILRGSEALARSVDAVSRRLGLWEQPFPLVLTGGLLLNSDFYRRVVSQAIRTRVPNARIQEPDADAATGAALLAREKLGYPLATRPSPRKPQNTARASEARNTLTQDLDLRTSQEVAGLMHLEDTRAISAVRASLPAIASAIDAISPRMRAGGRLIYVGAGTSGRLGVLDASECPPTFGTDPGQVIGLIAGGEDAVTRAVEGAEDDPAAGVKRMSELGVNPLDSVVGIAASGRTPFVIGALKGASQRGTLTIALVCNLPAPLAEIADHVIAPLVGPEVLSGSTRLKAGTAQKLVLNMISTGTMIRLGKTYSNLMVDMGQHNAKLQDRARRMVAQACEVDQERAAKALTRARGDIRTAILSIILDCPPELAKKRLEDAGGDLRAAIS